MKRLLCGTQESNASICENDFCLQAFSPKMTTVMLQNTTCCSGEFCTTTLRPSLNTNGAPARKGCLEAEEVSWSWKNHVLPKSMFLCTCAVPAAPWSSVNCHLIVATSQALEPHSFSAVKQKQKRISWLLASVWSGVVSFKLQTASKAANSKQDKKLFQWELKKAFVWAPKREPHTKAKFPFGVSESCLQAFHRTWWLFFHGHCTPLPTAAVWSSQWPLPSRDIT